MTFRKFLNLLFVFLLPCICSQASLLLPLSSDTLAIVNGKLITASAFAKMYAVKRAHYGFQDNMEMREGYLRNVVNDEILIAWAKSEGLHTTHESHEEYERIILQELVNAYAEKHILSTVKVTEEDLMEFYRRLHKKVKVRHLYARTKKEADSLYALLKAGISFDELAKEVFNDPRLKESGGDLGYIGLDETDPDFENAAFALQVGEISVPVKTVQGYSILRVDDIRENPFMTESDYAEMREKLRPYVQRRKNIASLKTFTWNYRTRIKLTFNRSVIRKLFVMLDTLFVQEKYIPKIERSKNILTSKVGNWSVGEALQALRRTKESQRKWIHSEENFEDFLAGLFIQRQIVREAKEEKLDRLAELQERIAYVFDSYLLSLLERKLKASLSVSDDSIRSFYLHHQELFREEPQVRLSGILVNDAKTADLVMRLLMAGEDFSAIAKKYSTQEFTARHGGDLGYFKKNELGELADAIFSLDVGGWRGPFIRDNKYLFVRCSEKKSSTLQPLEAVAGRIEELLREQMWYSERERKVNEYKNKIPCKVYFERLRLLTIH